MGEEVVVGYGPDGRPRALGHPTLSSGSPSMRIAGELVWNPETKQWDLNNKSRRFGVGPTDRGPKQLERVAELMAKEGIQLGQTSHFKILPRSSVYEVAARFLPAEFRLAQIWAAEGREVHAIPVASDRGKQNKRAPDALVAGVLTPTAGNPDGYGTVEFRTPKRAENEERLNNAVVGLVRSSFGDGLQAPRIHINGFESGLDLAGAERALNRVVGLKRDRSEQMGSLEWVRISGQNPDGTSYDILHNYQSGQRWQKAEDGKSWKLVPPADKSASPARALLPGSEADGKARFAAAQKIIEEGTGISLPAGGTRLDIDPKTMTALTEAFRADYTEAANSKGSSPAARGNLGHMDDHDNFFRKYEAAFAALGLDPASLKLAIAAHDIGKGFLDPLMAKHVSETGAGSEKVLGAFLRDFILSHEHHSISRVPGVVQKMLGEQGIDVDSPRGQELVLKYSQQVIEAIRLHNGVGVDGDLKKKYPSLSESELAQLRTAWWPVHFEKFSQALGLKMKQYGGSTTPLSVALNFIDRAVLTAPSAPAKLLAQNLGSMPWGPLLITNSTSKPAEGNIPIIKAQGDLLARLATTPEQKAAVQTLIEAAQAMNQNMIKLGETIARMSADAEQEGIRTKEGTVLLRRDKTWIRIDGTDPKAAFVEVLKGGKWVREQTTGQGVSPVDLLLGELARNGIWPKK